MSRPLNSDRPDSDRPDSDRPDSNGFAPAAAEPAAGPVIDTFAASKTVLSTQLARLKAATLKVIHARERLPQPLFWSLFHSELESIKRKRRKERALIAALYDVDWL